MEQIQFFKSLTKVLLAILFVFSPYLYFNICIDPYRIFHTETNNSIIEPSRRYRKMKHIINNPKKHDSFIFGSSRVNHIDPRKIPNTKYFNMTYSLGLPNAHFEDIQIMLQNGVKIKNLLIGIDYLSLIENPRIKDNDLLRKKYPSTLAEKLIFYKQYIFNMPNLSFIKKSFTSYSVNSLKLPEIGINARNSKTELSIDSKPQIHIQRINNLTPKSKNTPKPKIENNILQIKKIVDLAKTNNINLIFFINPTQTSTYLNLNLNNYYESLRKLAEITNYYDFSGLSSTAIDNMNYYETSHYRTKMGNLIIAEIFGTEDTTKTPSDFCNYVNQNNIENNISRHEKLFKEYSEAITSSCKYNTQINISDIDKTTNRQSITLETINGININSELDTFLISIPYIKMKGSINFGNIDYEPQVFVAIGNRFFNAKINSNTQKSETIYTNKKSKQTTWEINIPTSLVDSGLQTAKLLILSKNKREYSNSDISIVLNIIEAAKPIDLNNLQSNNKLVRYSIETINGENLKTFTDISNESSIRISGWAVDETNNKSGGGVIVSLNGVPYLSQSIISRFDVARNFNNSNFINSGWTINIPVFHLPLGEHELVFKSLNYNRTKYSSKETIVIFTKN